MESQEDLQKEVIRQLRNLNKKHNYHILMVVLLGFVWIERAFVTLLCSYVFMNPIFDCNGIQTSQPEACTQLDQCTVRNDFTGTFFNNLYCQRKEIRSAFQSLQFVGSIVSLIFISPLGDAKGRRWVFLFSMVLCMVGVPLVITGIYKNMWELIVVGQFLNGAAVNGLGNASMIIASQFFSKKGRQNTITFFWVCWSIGFTLFMPIYYFMPEWYKFLIYLVAIPLIFLFGFSYYFLLQTPHFHLLVEKNQQKFDECIDKIAKYNNSDPQTVDKVKKLAKLFIDSHPKEENKNCKFVVPFKGQLQKIIQYGALRPFIVTTCIKTGTNMFYYGLVFCMQKNGYNYGVSMLIIGIHDTLGAFLANFLIKNTSAKKGMIISIVISWILGMLFIFNYVKTQKTLQSILAAFCSISAIIGFNYVNLMILQFFTPEVKSNAVGLGDAFCQSGKIIAPFLNSMLSQYNLHPMVPSANAYLLVGLVPMLFLPEIGNVVEQEQRELREWQEGKRQGQAQWKQINDCQKMGESTKNPKDESKVY